MSSITFRFSQISYKFFQRTKIWNIGVRNFTKCFNKPLLGGIIKPKTGITPEVLLEMVKELVEGGVNFIKEDEILSNPSFCPIKVRVPLIMKYLKERELQGFDPVIYAVCINSDPIYILNRVREVYTLGANAIHVNFWCGLGVYKSIRDLDLPLFLHFQKSGDKILTNKNHDYHIDWKVICQLAGMMGVDFIHAGMWGGYMNNDEKELMDIQNVLHSYNVLPAYSCGMHPGIVNALSKRFGVNYLANCGGSIHGHPGGTISGAKAMRQAIDQKLEETEYLQAIEKFGIIL